MLSFLNRVTFARKLTLLLLLTLIIANAIPNSYILNSAEASISHHSKAKNDGTGVGEGTLTDKKHKHTAKVTSFKASTASAIQNSCNCVIFRLDDVQDYWINGIQSVVMDQFIQKNQPLSVGVIMDYIGDDASIVNKVNQGSSLGLFELSIHGWDHVDYSQLNLTEQVNTLQQANDKMKTLFGTNSNVFIPPYDTFNDNTLVAMKSLGYKIISPADWADSYPHYVADGQSKVVDNYGIYHLQESTGFVEFNNDTSTRVSNSQILSIIDSKVASQGYAVITLHAQDFRQKVNGVSIDIINQTEIQDLNSLMNSINSKNYHIRTFNQVIQFKQTINTSTTVISNVNPSVVGQKITFTASVKVLPSGGIPAGNVTFSIDGTNQPAVQLSNGQATFTTTSLSAGGSGHVITASYSGTSKYSSSTSTVLNQKVNPNPQVKLIPTNGPVGGTVIVTGTNYHANSAVTITYGDVTQNIKPTTTNGTGFFSVAFTIPPSTVGTHAVSVTDFAAGFATASFIVTPSPFPITVMNDTTASSGLSVFSGRQMHAEFVSPNSQLISKSIDTITIKLKKVGSPTGTAQIGMFNADLSIKKLFGTKDVATLTSSYADYTFTLPNELYIISSGDRIGIKFAGGNTINNIGIMTDNNSADPFDGTHSYHTYYDTTWKTFPANDLYMKLQQTHP